MVPINDSQNESNGGDGLQLQAEIVVDPIVFPAAMFPPVEPLLVAPVLVGREVEFLGR